MAGELVRFGNSYVYVPPFVHQERNQCTMTAAQMAANIAWLGEKPATQAEVRKLAADSGLPGMPDKGYTTGHMMTALTTHYGLAVRNVGLSLEEWRTRLQHGWAALVAVKYPELPDEFRLFKDFQDGHRLLITGFDGNTGQTLLIDPLRNEVDPARDRIRIRRLYEAQEGWRTWQVWVREGQELGPGVRVAQVLDQPFDMTFAKGDRCTLVHKRLPGLAVEHAFDEETTLTVDRIGRRRKRSGEDGPPGPVYRIADGDLPRLTGWWVDPPQGVKVPGPALPDPAPANNVREREDRFQEGYRAGVADERDRWTEWLSDGPPTGDGPSGPALDDLGLGLGLG